MAKLVVAESAMALWPVGEIITPTSLVGRTVLPLYRQATASTVRCIVFSVLLVLALCEATFVFYNRVSLLSRMGGFFGSLLGSLVLIMLIVRIWDLIADRWA